MLPKSYKINFALEIKYFFNNPILSTFMWTVI